MSALSFSGVLALIGGSPAMGAERQVAGGKLRDMTTDRPDSTETPFTVDVAHWQVELDAVSYTQNRLNGVRTTEWEAAPVNFRYGLTANTEVGLFVTPYVEVTEKLRSGEKTTWRGVGDTTLRAKVNFQGNDGGSLGTGVFVDLKLPTAKDGLGNDEVDGAVTLPVAFEVGGGWAGSAMTSLEFPLTATERDVVWVNTLSFGREIAPNTGAFFEVTSAAGAGSHVATFNCGVTRRFGPHLQLDGGFNLGITRTAPDVRLFLGLSRKY